MGEPPQVGGRAQGCCQHAAGKTPGGAQAAAWISRDTRLRTLTADDHVPPSRPKGDVAAKASDPLGRKICTNLPGQPPSPLNARWRRLHRRPRHAPKTSCRNGSHGSHHGSVPASVVHVSPQEERPLGCMEELLLLPV